jgi:hypothetical protein
MIILKEDIVRQECQHVEWIYVPEDERKISGFRCCHYEGFWLLEYEPV